MAIKPGRCHPGGMANPGPTKQQLADVIYRRRKLDNRPGDTEVIRELARQATEATGHQPAAARNDVTG